METPKDFENDLTSCLSVLRSGGLILYPTDTIWGIGCDATDAEAVSKVFALKKRSETKSLIVLVADQRDILQHTSQPDLRIFDFLQSVQKPTTVIYEGAIGLAPNLVNADGTIAIRLVEDPFCRHLVKRFRKPLVSTSANLSGTPSPGSFADISDEVKAGVDYIVHHRRDDASPRQPSSIIKWNAEGPPTIIRP